MCSKDSPSVKADGTTEAATLAAEYEEFSLDIEEQPLPGYRTEELRVRIEEVRQTLVTEEAASAGQLQQLLRTVTEALADVRAAQVVAVPSGRDLSQAVPGANDTGAAYEVTATEQRKTVNVLVNLLFAVVETPTHEDRRRRDGSVGSDDARGGHTVEADSETNADSETSADTDSGADADTDSETSQAFEAGGYAGPE